MDIEGALDAVKKASEIVQQCGYIPIKIQDVRKVTELLDAQNEKLRLQQAIIQGLETKIAKLELELGIDRVIN